MKKPLNVSVCVISVSVRCEIISWFAWLSTKVIGGSPGHNQLSFIRGGFVPKSTNPLPFLSCLFPRFFIMLMYFLCFGTRDFRLLRRSQNFEPKLRFFRVYSFFPFRSLMVQFHAVAQTSFSSNEYRWCICICSWRSGERKLWIKQDLIRSRNLYQACDLLVEVHHTFIDYFWRKTGVTRAYTFYW